jgi:hypothetical protein
MNRIKFFFTVFIKLLFTRPQRWEWEYKKLKDEHQKNKPTSVNF